MNQRQLETADVNNLSVAASLHVWQTILALRLVVFLTLVEEMTRI
jgi:hypothetical protein